MRPCRADFVFSKPLDAADGTNRCSEGVAADAAALRADEATVTAVGELREIFLTRKECLVHGDLHTGSIMVPTAAVTPVATPGGADSAEGARRYAKMIDAEFAHFGCAAFDVGVFVAHLLFAWFAAEGEGPRTSIEGMVRDAWAAYTHAVQAAEPSPLPSGAALAETLALTAGFAGCELIRRVIGAAHVDDLESLAPPERKLAAERSALAAGRRLVTRRDSLAQEGIDALLACCGTAQDAAA